jgi:lysine-specific demethylase 3
MKREIFGRTKPGFVACSKKREHVVTDFSPVTRFQPQELDTAVVQMARIVSEDSADFLPGVPAELGTVVSLQPPLPPAGPATSEPLVDIPCVAEDTKMGLDSQQPSNLPSFPTRVFQDGELSEDAFRSLWALGDPLVIDGLLPKLKLPWSPEWFIAVHGKEACKIVDCQTEEMADTRVADFFSMFGKYGPDRKRWKLKVRNICVQGVHSLSGCLQDWPPATDFKTTFPVLYEDFLRTAPIPSYVRRDGVFNLVSHFPFNAVAPDLGEPRCSQRKGRRADDLSGPKMYNAQATSDEPGSFGTTRLHMDMSDAMNIMTFACKTPDGADGYAIWDLFKAGDANKLRLFLRSKFVIPDHVDPIHAQKWYLDVNLRKQLFEEHGVKSHRIYQVPGQAVFIPAGCAHQVRFCYFSTTGRITNSL